jgi:hypothetical protein
VSTDLVQEVLVIEVVGLLEVVGFETSHKDGSRRLHPLHQDVQRGLHKPPTLIRRM